MHGIAGGRSGHADRSPHHLAIFLNGGDVAPPRAASAGRQAAWLSSAPVIIQPKKRIALPLAGFTAIASFDGASTGVNGRKKMGAREVGVRRIELGPGSACAVARIGGW